MNLVNLYGINFDITVVYMQCTLVDHEFGSLPNILRLTRINVSKAYLGLSQYS